MCVVDCVFVYFLHEKNEKISAFATAKLFSHVVKQRVPTEREGEQNNVHNIIDNNPRKKKYIKIKERKSTSIAIVIFSFDCVINGKRYIMRAKRDVK